MADPGSALVVAQLVDCISNTLHSFQRNERGFLGACLSYIPLRYRIKQLWVLTYRLSIVMHKHGIEDYASFISEARATAINGNNDMAFQLGRLDTIQKEWASTLQKYDSMLVNNRQCPTQIGDVVPDGNVLDVDTLQLTTIHAICRQNDPHMTLLVLPRHTG